MPTTKRAGTVHPSTDTSGRVYYRGRIRLQDNALARVTIDEPECYSLPESRAFVANAQAIEDETHPIYNARLAGEAKRAGVLALAPSSAATPVGVYKSRFFAARRAAGRVADVESEVGRLKHMTDLDDVPIGDVRTPMVRTAVARMRREATRPDGTPISARTVIHVYRTFALMVRTAVAEGVIRVNPCVLLPGDLPKKADKDPKWRKGARFTAQELTAIVTDERIPHDRRTFYALLLLGCTRFGEAAALRWDAYDATATPLGKLTIEASYSTKKRKEKTTKTDVAREMPVLPLLASLLADWKASGFAAMTGREPTPADLIVPSRLGRNRNANHMLRRFHQDLERLGMRVRRQHDARRTFISLAREGGASDLLKWATHGPGTEITDLYTTPDWASLCAEASKVNLAPLPSPGPTSTEAATEATKEEEAEGVTTSTSSRRSQLGSPFAENPAFYGECWRGGRDSNPRPPA